MSFFGRIKSAVFGGSVPSPYSMMQGLFQTGQPPRRGSKEMLEAYKRLPWFHAAVHRIAQDIGSLEWELYAPVSRREMKSRKMKNRWKRRDAALTDADDQLAEVEVHPFLDMLAKPNPILGPIGTFFLAQAYLEVKGEVPVVLERAGDGLPIELWPVPPNWLQAGPSMGEDFWRFNYAGWYAQVPSNGVLLMREPDLTNPYGRGIGVGDALADELDIDEFAAQHIKSWFYNRALPDAFISMEGLTDEKQALKYEEKLRQKHQGVGKGGQIHVSNGKLDVKVLSQTFKEQQLAETRGQQRDTILQVMNIPPEVMGIIENSNRATIDAAYFLYATGVLMPRAKAMAAWLTTLAQEWNPAFVVGPESFIPEDKEFALKVMTSQPDLFRKNEFRCIAGEEPAEEFGEDFVEKSAPPSFGAPGLPPPADPKLIPPGSDTAPAEDPSADPLNPDDGEDKSAKRGRLLPLRSTGHYGSRR